MNGLHIALWSESMSSPCKALGLILSTKGRWGEARRRKEKEREVCISELCLLYTFPWEAAGAEAVFRGGEIFQTHSFYTWSAGGSGHQQWDFLQESSQHIRGLGPSTSVLAEHIYSLKGKVPFQLLPPWRKHTSYCALKGPMVGFNILHQVIFCFYQCSSGGTGDISLIGSQQNA